MRETYQVHVPIPDAPADSSKLRAFEASHTDKFPTAPTEPASNPTVHRAHADISKLKAFKVTSQLTILQHPLYLQAAHQRLELAWIKVHHQRRQMP